jgi:endoglucanase
MGLLDLRARVPSRRARPLTGAEAQYLGGLNRMVQHRRPLLYAAIFLLAACASSPRAPTVPVVSLQSPPSSAGESNDPSPALGVAGDCDVSIASGASDRADQLAGRGGYFFTFADQLGTSIAPLPEEYAPTGGLARVRGRLGSRQPAFAGLGLNLTEPVGFYDASRYTGLAFEAKSGPGIDEVRLGVTDVNTSPDGERCSECYNDFGANLELSSDWQEYRFSFEALYQQPGWGSPRPAQIEPRALRSILFTIFGQDEDYDLTIRNLRFLGCHAVAH